MSNADHFTDGADDSENSDDLEAYREESEFSLDDLKASDEPVEKYATIGGRELRFLVKEAADEDAPDLDRRSEAEVYRALAEFFRNHIVEPDAFADVTAADLREMKMGVAQKLLKLIVPETDEGNRML